MWFKFANGLWLAFIMNTANKSEGVGDHPCSNL